ncbi:MAG: acyl carrier protein [Pseudomonadota bacterium]
MSISETLLFEHIQDSLGDNTELDANSELFSTGLLDSAEMMRLIAFLDEKTGIDIGMEDVTLENFDTVARIQEFVAAKR